MLRFGDVAAAVLAVDAGPVPNRPARCRRSSAEPFLLPAVVGWRHVRLADSNRPFRVVPAGR